MKYKIKKGGAEENPKRLRELQRDLLLWFECGMRETPDSEVQLCQLYKSVCLDLLCSFCTCNFVCVVWILQMSLWNDLIHIIRKYYRRKCDQIAITRISHHTLINFDFVTPAHLSVCYLLAFHSTTI